jgi:flagellar hook-length control protein FliK
VDFSTLISGSAQAGSPSPASKPGIGLTAGAGTSPGAGAAGAAAENGFASLIALALDQLDGTATAACGSTAATTCYAPVDVDDANDVDTKGDDDTLPLDPSVDAATLSVLMALATPVPAPLAQPQPEVVEQGSAAPVTVEAGRTTVVESADVAAPRAASRVPTVDASNAGFEDALTAASATSSTPAAGAVEAPAVPAPSAPVAAPAASVPTAPAVTAAPEAPGVPAAPTAAAEAPATPSATAAAPEAASAIPAPAPTDAATPTAAPAAVPSRAGQRPAAHPLRQALAAIAATSAEPASSSTSASAPAQTTAAAATPRTAGTAGVAPTEGAGHDARVTTLSRLDSPQGASAATAPAFTGGSTADSSSDGSRDGYRAASIWRGAEAGLEKPTILSGAAPVNAPDVAIPAPMGSLTGTTDTLLRAMDVPTAARFEQTLSSVDPDVRNLQTMVRTVRLFAAGNGATEARLTLDPEHLGPVALTVRVEQGAVSAHFRADTPAAQRWIETHQQELRSGLREQGLEVKEVVVTTDPDGRRDRRQEPQQGRQARGRRTPTGADAPRFEVLV